MNEEIAGNGTQKMFKKFVGYIKFMKRYQTETQKDIFLIDHRNRRYQGEHIAMRRFNCKNWYAVTLGVGGREEL